MGLFPMWKWLLSRHNRVMRSNPGSQESSEQRIYQFIAAIFSGRYSTAFNDPSTLFFFLFGCEHIGGEVFG